MSKEKVIKLRTMYLFVIGVLVALGLLSRRIRFIPTSCGDALWAMMVYCCFRIVLIKKPMAMSALASLITAFAVEFSQMLTPYWLVKIRSTFLGHILLGQGFLWSDLVAYTIGIAITFGLTALMNRRMHRKCFRLRKCPTKKAISHI